MSDTRRTSLEPKQVAMLTALVVVVLALVYVLLLRGGEAPEGARPDAAAPPLAQVESEDPFEPDGNGAAAQPVETFEVFASRDPFEPIVEGETAERGQTQQGSGEPDDPTEPPGEDEGLGEGEIATGAPQANQEEVEGHTVKLIDVFREGGEGRAQVQIDATGYTVAPGEVFAENFQLMSTSGTCATMLYGDDQFTLCEGEEILK